MATVGDLQRHVTADDVYAALAEMDAGRKHRFGKATKYVLLHEGRQYPPKAVFGLAIENATGVLLEPREFSSGIGHAVTSLQKLGFVVRNITAIELDPLSGIGRFSDYAGVWV